MHIAIMKFISSNLYFSHKEILVLSHKQWVENNNNFNILIISHPHGSVVGLVEIGKQSTYATGSIWFGIPHQTYS